MSIRNLVPWRRRDASARRGDAEQFPRLRGDINRCCGGSRRAREEWFLTSGVPAGFVPNIALAEHDAACVLTAQTPGLDKAGLALELRGDTLRLRGEKKQEQKNAQSDCVYREWCYGSFQRAIPLAARRRPAEDNRNVRARRSDGDAAQDRGHGGPAQDHYGLERLNCPHVCAHTHCGSRAAASSTPPRGRPRSRQPPL